MLETQDRLLRIGQVCEFTGLRRSSLYRLSAEGRFPKPLKITERASAWSEAAVREWVRARIAGHPA